MTASQPDYELVPPDGGWGWMVVLGVALNTMTAQSFISVFGLLFGDTLHAMGHETISAALILNTTGAVINFSGMVTGPLMKKLSYRQVTLIGSVIFASGMILTSMASELWHMIVSFGLISGLGLGLITPSIFVVVNAYFIKNRGRAVGLSLAGTNVGQMWMPHLVRLLLEHYGFHGASLILAAVSLHSFVGAMLFQPLKWHAKRRLVEAEPLHPAGPRRSDSGVSVQSIELGEYHVEDRKQKKEKSNPPQLDQNLETPYKENERKTWYSRFVSFMDLDLLKDPVFVMLVIGSASVYTSNISTSMILPFYLRGPRGLSLSDTALCMTLLAAADFASRVILPPITDRIKMKGRHTFLIAAVCMAFMRSGLAMMTHMTGLAIMSFMSGFFRGLTVVNMNIAVSEHIAKEKVPAAVGINMVVKGIFILGIGPLLGYIRDETESYPLILHILSAIVWVPMFVWFLEFLISRIRRNR